jgi:hypothetical protein
MLARQNRPAAVPGMQRRRGRPGRLHGPEPAGGQPPQHHRGMLIGAFATGASGGRDLRPGRVSAGHQAPPHRTPAGPGLGLLGDDILGRASPSTSELVKGAGAFVCGEETALIRSIEGARRRAAAASAVPGGARHRRAAHGDQQRGDVGQRAAHHRPGQCGVRRGWDGTGSTGTKIFSLVGQVSNTGLVEVPMGVSMRHRG